MHLHMSSRITERGNYNETDARNLITQVLDGVAYLHANGEGAQTLVALQLILHLLSNLQHEQST